MSQGSAGPQHCEVTMLWLAIEEGPAAAAAGAVAMQGTGAMSAVGVAVSALFLLLAAVALWWAVGHRMPWRQRARSIKTRKHAGVLPRGSRRSRGVPVAPRCSRPGATPRKRPRAPASPLDGPCSCGPCLAVVLELQEMMLLLWARNGARQPLYSGMWQALWAQLEKLAKRGHLPCCGSSSSSRSLRRFKRLLTPGICIPGRAPTLPRVLFHRRSFIRPRTSGCQRSAILPGASTASDSLQPRERLQPSENLPPSKGFCPAESLSVSENVHCSEGIDFPRASVLSESFQQPGSLPPSEGFSPSERLPVSENVHCPESLELPRASVLSESFQPCESLPPSDSLPDCKKLLPSEKLPVSENLLPSESLSNSENPHSSENLPVIQDLLPSECLPVSENLCPSESLPDSESLLPAESLPICENLHPSESLDLARASMPSDSFQPSEILPPSESLPLHENLQPWEIQHLQGVCVPSESLPHHSLPPSPRLGETCWPEDSGDPTGSSASSLGAKDLNRGSTFLSTEVARERPEGEMAAQPDPVQHCQEERVVQQQVSWSPQLSPHGCQEAVPAVPTGNTPCLVAETSPKRRRRFLHLREAAPRRPPNTRNVYVVAGRM